jgi:adenosylcobalamin-dependent ribonucleoside-triphosphate reductase
MTVLAANDAYQAISYNENAENRADRFRLDNEFLKGFRGKSPKFGYNGLGELVYYRTYSRTMPDGRKETFCDTVQRVVEGCFEIQRRHSKKIHIPWDYDKAQRSAQEMFQRIWDFKFLPPGRGLWMMGTEFMWTRGSAALNNCGFVSTSDIDTDPAEPFCFLMDMSMLGVGVGFDTKGAKKVKVNEPAPFSRIHVVGDSREGWVESVRQLIFSYTTRSEDGFVDFDYSEIRKEGSDIKGFGGKASGPKILRELHGLIAKHLDKKIGKHLSSVDITDIMNYIGRCVVAGNVRRTAEIAFGEIDDMEYASMKNYKRTLKDEDLGAFYEVTGNLWAAELNRNKDNACPQAKLSDFELNGELRIPEDRLIPAIETWNAVNMQRWASNNSIFAKVGMNYDAIAEQIAVNGEPGFIWLDNVRDYGRMKDGYKPGIDGRVKGSNPCVEQSLESYELCNLVETFPANHDDAEDYMRTLKFAYLYAKTVTLLPTHNARTNQVTLRNRRIGLSQSGIAQAFAKFGRRNVLNDFCDAGYNEIRRWDKIYSEWLCIPTSIKVTSVKPSGTVSLLVGATPGIHHPEARHYWRRMRLAKDSPLVPILIEAGYHIEPVLSDPDRTVVVKFAISDPRVRPVADTTIWEQMANASDYQLFWADNQVSCTVKFKNSERDQIALVLEAYEDKLKGISFLPATDHGYAQAPYEPCTEQEVIEYNMKVKPVDYSKYLVDAVGSVYCDNDSCEVRK